MTEEEFYHRARYKEWRDKVLRRAGYLCEICKRYGKNVPAKVAHHIKPRSEFPDLQYDVRNGQALCSKCHNKAHPEKGGYHNPPISSTDRVTFYSAHGKVFQPRGFFQVKAITTYERRREDGKNEENKNS